jgi:hypothetical protein
LIYLYRLGLELSQGRSIIWFIKLALSQCALFTVASWLICKTPGSKTRLTVVLIFAALFRLSILFSAPTLSDDIYRYVWDGRVQAAGINPYRYIPADPNLAALRDDAIYPKINRKDYAHTIYPPAAQMFFFIVTRVSASITGMKTAMVLAEAVTVWAIILLLNLLGLARDRILLYAWHPLVVWHFAGSGHLDALAIAFIMLAFLARVQGRSALTGIALGIATLVKLYPVALLPALYRRRDWKSPVAFVATVLCGYIPYLTVGLKGVLGFLPEYTHEEGIESGTRFFLLSLANCLFGESKVTVGVYKLLSICALGGLAIWVAHNGHEDRRSMFAKAAILACGCTIILSPRYSWYITWLVPFLCFFVSAPILYLTFAGFCLYALWRGELQEHALMINSVIYGPASLLLLLELFRRYRTGSRFNSVNTAEPG